jgi:serine/threonine protein kinase
MAMGTLHYMAPEALMLGSAVDHRADVYAVGVMLYQMLTGKIPQGLFELPSLQVPGLDPRYDGIIGAFAGSKDPIPAVGFSVGLDALLAAFEAVEADYARHSRAARRIAEEYFDAEKVLARLLKDLGL